MKFVRLRRRHAVLLVLAVAAAVYTSLAVSPAAGATVGASADCYDFNSVSMLGSDASSARGAEGREPSLKQVAEEVPASGQGKGGNSFRATVPVYFHVVTPDGVTGNVTLNQINAEIRAMNAGFSGAEAASTPAFGSRSRVLTARSTQSGISQVRRRPPSVR